MPAAPAPCAAFDAGGQRRALLGCPADAGQANRALSVLSRVEWPTLVMLGACYGLWWLGSVLLVAISLPLAIGCVALAVALHSSLSHEALHGHPFRSRRLNAALVFPAISVTVPYLRFRDTHLAHHRDERLTDPYDDPESNYLDPARWHRLARPHRALLRLNNCLAGRLILGPAIGTGAFLRRDLAAALRGDGRVILGWCLHLPAFGLVVLWLWAVAQMPLWAWACSVYAGLSILKVRTFLEHRAHRDVSGRTVVIEDRGLLSWIFLNNNLHAVHHRHPRAPWYRLPGLYRAHARTILAENDGYRYRSYGEVMRRYFWRAKDPVPHPLQSAPEARSGARPPD